MALSRRNENSNLNQQQSLRETRIEQRRNYTDAATSKGADREGLARGTNRIYDEVYDERPSGQRDQWSEEDQKKIAVAENFAANKVRSLPEPEGRSQQQINNDVVNASGEGGQQASEYIADQKENGNWWSRLF